MRKAIAICLIMAFCFVGARPAHAFLWLLPLVGQALTRTAASLAIRSLPAASRALSLVTVGAGAARTTGLVIKAAGATSTAAPRYFRIKQAAAGLTAGTLLGELYFYLTGSSSNQPAYSCNSWMWGDSLATINNAGGSTFADTQAQAFRLSPSGYRIDSVGFIPGSFRDYGGGTLAYGVRYKWSDLATGAAYQKDIYYQGWGCTPEQVGTALASALNTPGGTDNAYRFIGDYVSNTGNPDPVASGELAEVASAADGTYYAGGGSALPSPVTVAGGTLTAAGAQVVSGTDTAVSTFSAGGGSHTIAWDTSSNAPAIDGTSYGTTAPASTGGSTAGSSTGTGSTTTGGSVSGGAVSAGTGSSAGTNQVTVAAPIDVTPATWADPAGAPVADGRTFTSIYQTHLNTWNKTELFKGVNHLLPANGTCTTMPTWSFTALGGKTFTIDIGKDWGWVISLIRTILLVSASYVSLRILMGRW